MVIGVVSDTHGLLRPELLAAFRGVERIIHAGDVGDPDILLALEAIAPVTAVWGNSDGWDLRSTLPETITMSCAGVDVFVLHGHQLGSPTGRIAGASHSQADVVVFGHSHRPEIELVGGTLALNPGSAGPARFNLPITAALLTVGEAQPTARIVDLVSR